MKQPQDDFIPVNGPADHMAGLTREQALAYLRHPLSEAEAARYETILHDDPLPRPAGWEDRALPDEPIGPVSPTLLAASWRAGQRHVDAIRDNPPFVGTVAPGDAPTVTTGAPENGVSARASEDGRDWRSERMQARADVRQRVRVEPDTPRFWEAEQAEQRREAWGSARMLALAVACALLAAAVGGALWGAYDVLHRMGKL